MDHFECGDEQLVEAIRRTELKTYREAPNRIRADFNDEQETFHDYGGRLVWELLQNAHDAMGEGNISDVLIGSKGLGFKSVLEITNEPEIHSGDYHFLFSARRTQKLLKKKKLHDDPPLLTFRIPHECKPTRKTQELLNEGYVTVIRLPFRDKQAQKMVMDRLHNLDALFLLLAQKLSCVRIRTRAGETVHEMKTRSAGLSNGDVKLSTWGPNGYSQSSLWRRWVRCCSSPTDNEQQLTVAICLPTSEQGYVVSHNTNIPFHVFFPTDETSGTRALIHASLDLEHNRKRVRKGQHDDAIREEFQKLFQDVLKDIPARTALETFGNVVSEDRDSPLIDLQRDIRDTLCQTPFVPVIGGDRVRPGDVQLWNDRLGLVLRDDAKEVQKACLLASELRDMAGVIESFGAQDIENEDYIRLLRYCRNESIKECFASWRVLIKGGLKRILSEYSKNEDRADLLERLRKVPCWWTGKETARALNGNRPLLLVRPEDWPDWLLADSLHPRMRKVLERYDTRLNKENQSEILQIWKELISKRLLKEQKEFLHYALLPFIAEWDLGHWKSDGWRMLRQVLSWWSPSRTFDRTTPWIEKTESETERDQERRSLVENLYLLSDKGWLPAADCYAGEAWDGPPVFDRFFASIEDRGLVLPFKKWPNYARKKTTKNYWKVFLRWVGVSWEPKIRRVGIPRPENNDWKAVWHWSQMPWKPEFKFVKYLEVSNLKNRCRYSDGSYYGADWEIEYFSEFIREVNDSDKSASIIRRLISLAKAVKQKRATYYKPYNQSVSRHPQKYDNFADYQLLHEKWLPCKPALFHDGRRVDPRQAFFPRKGLGGLLPEVDRRGVGDEEWFQLIMPALRSLGVQDDLPEDPTDWHEWMRKLPRLAKQLDKSERKVSERGKDTSRLCRAADALYRRYLDINIGVPWGLNIDKFPDDIDVPYLSWKDSCEILAFSPPSDVYHVDEPHFDEVRRDILAKGHKLFLLKLNAGKRAPERLGVLSLSDVLLVEPNHKAPDQQAGERLLKCYCERRLGLSAAAGLAKQQLPEELNLLAVRELRLKLTDHGTPVTDVEVLSWKTEDSTLLINLDKDEWRALGHGLAARIVGKERNASLFENLLREPDKEGYLDRLRHEGVTEDDIREAENAWTLGKPYEQGSDGGVPPIQEPPQGSTLSATSSQGTTSGSRNRQEVVHQTLQPKTGSGGGVRPSSTPLETEWNTSGKGVSRPRPETGQAAENWLEKKLEQAFPNCVQRRVRDDENRESDFVVSSGSREFHIEVKHVANWPGLFYWSELECEKAQVIEKSNNEYIMAILSPNDDRGYKIRWIWHPLNELKRASREVQWTGNSNYESVDTDSWDVETWRPDEVPTKRHRFRIKLDDEVVKGFEEDTGNLGVMCRKIDSLNAEMGIES